MGGALHPARARENQHRVATTRLAVTSCVLHSRRAWKNRGSTASSWAIPSTPGGRTPLPPTQRHAVLRFTARCARDAMLLHERLALRVARRVRRRRAMNCRVVRRKRGSGRRLRLRSGSLKSWSTLYNAWSVEYDERKWFSPQCKPSPPPPSPPPSPPPPSPRVSIGYL